MKMKYSTLLVIPLLVLAMSANVILETSCSSQQNISELVGVLGNAVAAVAAAENNPTLAAKLKVDTQRASTQILNWKNGSPAQDAIEALNLLQDDLDLIPAASPYIALVDIGIGAIDAILAQLPQGKPSPASPANSFLSAEGAAAATEQVGHQHRHPALAKPAPKNAKEFKKQWNALVKAHPEWKDLKQPN